MHSLHGTLRVAPGAFAFHRDMLLPIPVLADFNLIRRRRQTLIDDNARIKAVLSLTTILLVTKSYLRKTNPEHLDPALHDPTLSYKSTPKVRSHSNVCPMYTNGSTFVASAPIIVHRGQDVVSEHKRNKSRPIRSTRLTHSLWFVILNVTPFLIYMIWHYLHITKEDEFQPRPKGFCLSYSLHDHLPNLFESVTHWNMVRNTFPLRFDLWSLFYTIPFWCNFCSFVSVLFLPFIFSCRPLTLEGCISV